MNELVEFNSSPSLEIHRAEGRTGGGRRWAIGIGAALALGLAAQASPVAAHEFSSQEMAAIATRLVPERPAVDVDMKAGRDADAIDRHISETLDLSSNHSNINVARTLADLLAETWGLALHIVTGDKVACLGVEVSDFSMNPVAMTNGFVMGSPAFNSTIRYRTLLDAQTASEHVSAHEIAGHCGDPQFFQTATLGMSDINGAHRYHLAESRADAVAAALLARYRRNPERIAEIADARAARVIRRRAFSCLGPGAGLCEPSQRVAA